MRGFAHLPSETLACLVIERVFHSIRPVVDDVYSTKVDVVSLRVAIRGLNSNLLIQLSKNKLRMRKRDQKTVGNVGKRRRVSGGVTVE